MASGARANQNAGGDAGQQPKPAAAAAESRQPNAPGPAAPPTPPEAPPAPDAPPASPPTPDVPTAPPPATKSKVCHIISEAAHANVDDMPFVTMKLQGRELHISGAVPDEKAERYDAIPGFDVLRLGPADSDAVHTALERALSTRTAAGVPAPPPPGWLHENEQLKVNNHQLANDLNHLRARHEVVIQENTDLRAENLKLKRDGARTRG